MSDRSMKRIGVVTALAVLAAAAIVSCAGEPKGPAGAVEKMAKAHGGLEAVGRLGSFSAHGFIRDLSDTVVARSNSFDLYRSGNRYKHIVLMAPAGTLAGLIVLTHDGASTVEWTSRGGSRPVAANELAMLPYRFPAVIAWAKAHAASGTIVGGKEKADREMHIRYALGDSILTLSIDRRTWLLSGVDLASASDTAAGYGERYDTYMDVDGSPFPARFTGSFRGVRYYEYLLSTVELRSEMPDSLLRLNAADTAAFARRGVPPAAPK